MLHCTYYKYMVWTVILLQNTNKMCWRSGIDFNGILVNIEHYR